MLPSEGAVRRSQADAERSSGRMVSRRKEDLTAAAPRLTRSHPPIHPGLERAPLRHLLVETVSHDPEHEWTVHQVHRQAERADGTRIHDQQFGPERRIEAAGIVVYPAALLLEDLNPGDDERVA